MLLFAPCAVTCLLAAPAAVSAVKLRGPTSACASFLRLEGFILSSKSIPGWREHTTLRDSLSCNLVIQCFCYLNTLKLGHVNSSIFRSLKFILQRHLIARLCMSVQQEILKTSPKFTSFSYSPFSKPKIGGSLPYQGPYTLVHIKHIIELWNTLKCFGCPETWTFFQRTLCILEDATLRSKLHWITNSLI